MRTKKNQNLLIKYFISSGKKEAIVTFKPNKTSLKTCEENHKRLKQWVEIGNFSGKYAPSVKQDFYAKIVA